MTENWDSETDSLEVQATRIVAGLVRLAEVDEACQLLGVEGTLEDELDVTFLNDPLGWVASEIASAIRGSEAEEEGVSLSTVVAMLRLYRILQGGPVDETELRDAVVEFLSGEEGTDQE
jgi:hypothetical protein